jgi:glycosyltransferase involved in cell wall biosynthesis
MSAIAIVDRCPHPAGRMRVLVVVPAYNEQASIGSVIADVKQVSAQLGISADVAVVDDGSSDHTSQAAFSSGARVIRLCRNLGIGGAVQVGLRAALREGFDCAVQIDGDGQHPASELSKLLAPLSEPTPPDLVIGTRYQAGEGFRSTALRRFGSRWLRLLLRVIIGQRVTDPTSGYRVYGPRALRLFDETYPYDYPEPEALAIAAAARLLVREVPVQMRERQHGRSSISGLAAPYYMLKTSLAVVLSYLRNRSRGRKGGT